MDEEFALFLKMELIPLNPTWYVVLTLCIKCIACAHTIAHTNKIFPLTTTDD